jgi:gliding motility-associated-like protein
MKHSFQILIILFFSFNLKAQHIITPNLVPNPSFEDYYSCPPPPCNTGNLIYCKNWTSGIGSNNSSDYFNTCSNGASCINAISIQYPRTGNAMAGIELYDGPIGNDNREYLINKLINNLKGNKRYCANLFTSLSNYSYGAIQNIGLLFSMDSIFAFTSSGLLNKQPQIEYNRGIISDTLNWVKISGSFIANGDEKILVIGNFRDNANTNYQSNSFGIMVPYYFFDDVSVCECNFDINLGPDTTLCNGDSKILTVSLPNATFTWQDSSHAATYEVKEPGTYWVRAYVAEYNISSSDTIVITAEKEEICNPPLIIPNFMSPNGDNSNDNFQLGNLEHYDISLQIFNRWGNLIYQKDHYNNDYNCNGCANGVYYYLITAKSLRNGVVKEFHGSLTVFY